MWMELPSFLPVEILLRSTGSGEGIGYVPSLAAKDLCRKIGSVFPLEPTNQPTNQSTNQPVNQVNIYFGFYQQPFSVNLDFVEIMVTFTQKGTSFYYHMHIGHEVSTQSTAFQRSYRYEL